MSRTRHHGAPLSPRRYSDREWDGHRIAREREQLAARELQYAGEPDSDETDETGGGSEPGGQCSLPRVILKTPHGEVVAVPLRPAERDALRCEAPLPRAIARLR